MAKPKTQVDKIAQSFALCFTTDAGARVLKHLVDVFYDKQIFASGMDAMTMAHLDGKRAMVNYIRTMVRQGLDKSAAPAAAITETEESE